MSTEALSALDAKADWEGLLAAAASEVAERPAKAEAWFFKAKAELGLRRSEAALASVEAGNRASPLSTWGHLLLFQILEAGGRRAEGLERLEAFLTRKPGDETVKRVVVETLAEAGAFDEAIRWNRRRRAVAEAGARPDRALVVQAFVKADTLRDLFSSLVASRLDQPVDLLVVQDHFEGSAKFAAAGPKWEETAAVVAEWAPRLALTFAGVEILRNRQNLGTAPTCKRAIDHACARAGSFVFLEDDCLVAPSALAWMFRALDAHVGPAGPWFVGGESIFFDAKRGAIDADLLAEMRALSRRESLRGRFVEVDFVPSTCFGTTAELWRICGEVRAFPKGPESLTRFLRALGRKTIMPVVPHVKDVGMLHADGYSVAMLGAANVREIKGTYLLAEDFAPETVLPFAGDANALFDATVNLRRESLARLKP